MGSLEEACLTGFLCRLCSKMHRSVIHIYGEEGLINRLEFKINTYLPVTVSSSSILFRQNAVYFHEIHSLFFRLLQQIHCQRQYVNPVSFV